VASEGVFGTYDLYHVFMYDGTRCGGSGEALVDRAYGPESGFCRHTVDTVGSGEMGPDEPKRKGVSDYMCIYCIPQACFASDLTGDAGGRPA